MLTAAAFLEQRLPRAGLEFAFVGVSYGLRLIEYTSASVACLRLRMFARQLPTSVETAFAFEIPSVT